MSGASSKSARPANGFRRRLVRTGRWSIVGLLVLSAAWLVAACTSRDDRIDSYFGPTISTAAVTEHVDRRADEIGIPGLSLAIINKGEVVYAKTFGDADVQAGLPVTDRTIFEAASLSKPVFAQFVMTFVEDGTLDLDRPLHEYLPHPAVAGDPRAERITARMVLSHQTGFPNWRTEPGGQLPIHFEPGTAWGYSGEGYQYLAMALLELTGTDWAGLEQLFQERIAQPIGLERTVFIQTPETRRDKAEPYDEDGKWIDWPNDLAARANDDVFVAGASLHTDATDFSRWMIAVMDGELVGSDRYRELFTPHASPPPNGLELSYTLGFYRPHLPLTNLYGHGGNNDGFTSFFMLDPDKEWGYVVFTNSEYGEAFGEELMPYLLFGPTDTRLAATVGAVLVLVLTPTVICIRILVRLLWRWLRSGQVA